MSWSVSVTANGADFAAAVDALAIPDYYQSDEHQQAIRAAQVEQLEAAKSAITALVTSGALGDLASGTFIAGLNGHATAAHVAPGQYESPETIYLSVSRARE